MLDDLKTATKKTHGYIMGTLMLLVIPFIHLHEGNLLGKYSQFIP